MGAGCAAPGGGGGSDAEFSHVHGLGYLPASGTVLVATHHGLVHGVPRDGGWAWSYAGSERYDYMGFVQDAVRPDVLYSSGHPDDAQAYGGVHLGLRRSTDGGVTWEQRSLKGQVDFHGLASIPDVEGGLVGLWQGKLMESRDGGLTWRNHTAPARQPIDVAVTRAGAYLTSADGILRGPLGEASGWQRVADPEPGRLAIAIAGSPDGAVLFAGTSDGRAGGTWRSSDGGATWHKPAEPLLADAAVPVHVAFDPADPRHVLAATGAGAVLESRDAGVTWSVLRAA